MSLVLALAAVGAAAAHPATGTWALEQSPAEVAARQEAALARSLASLPRLLHGIARDRLATALTVCGTYALSVDGAPFSIQCDARDAYTRPLVGEHPATGRDGAPLVSTLDVQESGLLLTWRGESGARVNAFAVDGDRMVLQVQVTAERLAAPVQWEVSYQRR